MNHQQRARERGAVFVIVSLFMVVLFAFAGLSIDVGNTLLQRKKVHEACDSAALAAVTDWASGKTGPEVVQLARDFCVANGMSTNFEIVAIEPGTWVDATKTFVGPLGVLPPNTVPAVRVVGRRKVNMYFARVVGTTEMNPRVETVAVVGRALAAAGALPWGVCDGFVPVKCMPITFQFKDGGETNACSSSGPLSGNFGQLTLPGGSGGNWYEQNIIDGYNGTLRIGQWIDTDPGVSWGKTRSGIDGRIGGLPPYNCTPDSPLPDNKRLAIVPKVSTLDVSGKKQVQITGFYVIALDGYSKPDKTVSAAFLKSFSGTEIDPSAPPVEGELTGIALVR